MNNLTSSISPYGENGIVIHILGKELLYSNLTEQEATEVYRQFEYMKENAEAWIEYLNDDISLELTEYIYLTTPWTVYDDWKVGFFDENAGYTVRDLKQLLMHYIVEMYRLGTERNLDNVQEFAKFAVSKLCDIKHNLTDKPICH